MAKVILTPNYLQTRNEIARQSLKNFTKTLKKLRDQYGKLWKDQLAIVQSYEEFRNNVCSNCSVPVKQKEKQKNETSTENKNKENLPVNANNSSTPELVDELLTQNSIAEMFAQGFELEIEQNPVNNENSTSPEEVTQQLRSPVVSKNRRKRRKMTSQGKANVSETSSKTMSSFNDIFDDPALEEAMCMAVPDCLEIPATDKSNYDIVETSQPNGNKSKSCRQLFLGAGAAKMEIAPDGRKLRQTKLVLKPANPKPESLFTGEFEEVFKDDWKEEEPMEKEDQESTPGRVISRPNKNQKKDVLKAPISPPKKTKLDNEIIEILETTPQKSLGQPSKSSSNVQKNRMVPPAMDTATFFDIDTTYFAVPDDNTQHPPADAQRGKMKALEASNFGLTQDETFFTLIEKEKTSLKPVMNRHISTQVQKMVTNFDVVPAKKKTSPTHAYKGKTVRNKNERAKLNGWDCWECEKFYEGLDYTEEELKRHKQKCSRHRSKYTNKYCTPEGAWNPVFTEPMDST